MELTILGHQIGFQVPASTAPAWPSRQGMLHPNSMLPQAPHSTAGGSQTSRRSRLDKRRSRMSQRCRARAGEQQEASA